MREIDGAIRVTLAVAAAYIVIIGIRKSFNRQIRVCWNVDNHSGQ